MFLTAFLLGFFGSAGHCVGMCSGVTLLLARSGVAPGWRLLLAHVGRVTTYALLGAVAGSAGLALGPAALGTSHAAHGASAPATPLQLWQGGLALLAAGVTVYMGLAFNGRLPSPETYLTPLTRRWSQTMRGLKNGRFGLLTPLVAGLLWGLLPCGLVLTGLLTAVVAATPLHGTLLMITFGLGTWPLLLAVTLLSRTQLATPSPRLRTIAALLICLFGLQLALRGLAAWGLINHWHLNHVMVW